MSYNSNSSAIVNINSIIGKYNEAKDNLKNGNDTEKVHEIIKLIDSEISSLESIKYSINNLNYALVNEGDSNEN